MRLSRMHGLVLLGTLILYPSITWSPDVRASEPRIAGTYSNLHYIEEAGDLLGEEIKIVPGSPDYQGAFQVAQGAPEKLIVVDAKVEGPKIRFTIPDSSSYAGEFIGKVENAVLKGQFKFKSGVSEKVELPRGKGYWD